MTGLGRCWKTSLEGANTVKGPAERGHENGGDDDGNKNNSAGPWFTWKGVS